MRAVILPFVRSAPAPAKSRVSGRAVVIDLAGYRDAKRQWAWVKGVIERGRRKALGGAV
jgi:hypothetical protein